MITEGHDNRNLVFLFLALFQATAHNSVQRWRTAMAEYYASRHDTTLSLASMQHQNQKNVSIALLTGIHSGFDN